MIKAIIFDLGSVFFNEDWQNLNKEFMAKFGISTLIRSNYGPEIQEVYDETITGKKSMKDVFIKICELKGIKADANNLCKEYKEAYKRNRVINKEMADLIKHLRKKFKIVCATDTNELHYACHKEQGILDLFDEKFCSLHLGVRKKEKESFNKILNKLKLKPAEVVFIDDNEKNIENAKSFGIKAIRYTNNMQLSKELGGLGIK